MYSDPALFVNAWLTLMDKEAQQFKKGKKRSFKKAKDNNLSKIATLKKKVHARFINIVRHSIVCTKFV